MKNWLHTKMLFSIPANSIFYKTEAEEKFIHFHCELYFLFNFLFNYLLWILLTVFNFTIHFNLYRIDTIFTFPLMPFHNSKYYKKPLKSFWYKRKIQDCLTVKGKQLCPRKFWNRYTARKWQSTKEQLEEKNTSTICSIIEF